MAEQLPPEPLDLVQLGTLAQEKQTAAVFKWLADCESFLSDLTADDLSIHQQALIKAFLDLLSLPSPTLGRVLRACLGRCLSDIFERGDRKPLFDTVSTLLVRIAQFRVDKDNRQKQYRPYPEYYTLRLTSESVTIYCLGATLGAGSDSVMQLIPETVSTLAKVIKTSSSDTGLRAVAFDSLRKALVKQISLKDEGVAKELFKLARSGVSDKNVVIQERAAKVTLLQTTFNSISCWQNYSGFLQSLHLQLN
jgi:HEAT repeat-containing protein 5